LNTLAVSYKTAFVNHQALQAHCLSSCQTSVGEWGPWWWTHIT